MIELYVGVHHVPDGLSGISITLGTQAALPGGWVLGPSRPATHAFVVIREKDGFAWRLDGKPSRAEWSPFYNTPILPPTKLWKIVAAEDAVFRGATRARAITHVKYDWAEIASCTAVAFSFLPLAHKLKAFGRTDIFSGAMICTQVCRNVLMAIDSFGAIDRMPDLFPERLAQVLRGAEGTWTEVG